MFVGLVEIAVIVSLVVTIFIIGLSKMPMAKAPKILVITASDSDDINTKINEIIERNTKHFEEKTRRIAPFPRGRGNLLNAKD